MAQRSNSKRAVAPIALLLIASFAPFVSGETGDRLAKSTIKLPKKKVSRKKFRELADAATAEVQQFRSSVSIANDSVKAGRAAFAPEDGTREERLARTRDSALEFGRVYLSHYFESTGAVFHEALDKLLTGNYTKEDLQLWRDEYDIQIFEGDPLLRLLSIQIARGHAKSVIANLSDTLRRVCHGLDPFILIVGDTFSQAGAQLEDIKDELQSNEKIKEDFGSLKPARSRSVELVQGDDGRVVWREGLIVTQNNIRLNAIGRGAKVRGLRHGAQRITCAKVDDLENDESVVSKEQRDKAWNWMMSALVPALDPKRGQLQLIGTTIHFDCCVARAERKTNRAGQHFFTSIKFPAMRRAKVIARSCSECGLTLKDRCKTHPESEPILTYERGAVDGWVSNWPERFPIEKLLAIRELLGPAKFGAEYLNDPRDPETQLFDPDKFTYYLPQELDAIPADELEEILYIDPSKGKKGKGRKKSDFSGLSRVKHRRSTRVSYLIEADRKRLSPTAAKAYIVEWYRRVLQENPNAKLYVEENSFGSILGENFQDELRAQGVDKQVFTLLHSEEKPSRIDRHSVRCASGGFRFPQRFADEDRRPEWFAEYVDYPGPFDDTIDSNESADWVADKRPDAACASKDPEGTTSRDRLQGAREERWMAKLMGIRGRRAAA